MTQIRGSGFGGQKKKTQRAAVTADDNLNNTQRARVLCLLGEGEQEGFPSALKYARNSDSYEIAVLKDIYLNGTPILKSSAGESPSDSDYNFQGVSVTHCNGTAGQKSMRGFNQSESQFSVGLVVTKATPITRTISDSNVDAVRVTLTWPALQQYYDPKNKISQKLVKAALGGNAKSPQEGDLLGVEVAYQIQAATAGGPFKTIVDSKVTGRSADPYSRSHEILLTGPFPVDIRVLRITGDSTSTKISDQMTWSDYTLISYAKLTYPYSALLGVQFDAKYFSSWPTVSVKRRGNKVAIPDNASVDSTTGRLIYSGIWTGNFAAAQWTTDPAWILWDLMVTERYGFGQHCKASLLDRWSFYAASKYAAELVPDGRNGMEPRFSCSVNIQTQSQGFDLINQLCSVFRAMPYWGTDLMNISQDRPSTPIKVFHNSDVEGGQFRYVGASLRSQHTVVIVKYFSNEKQDYDYEVVEDSDGIKKYGSITTDIDAFACTSRGQARRLGEWLLYTEQKESEVVSIDATLAAGAEIRPGQIVSVMDDLKTGVRRAGKIITGTTTSFIVDDTSQTNLPSGPSATATVDLVGGVTETRSIASVAGGIIYLSAALSSLPLPGGTWSISDNAAKATTWRVISVGESDKVKYQITATRYNSAKYDYVERSVPLDETIYAPIVVPDPNPPASVTSVPTINSESGLIDLNLSWASVPGAVEYEVSYRKI
jgi:hypothetical protein